MWFFLNSSIASRGLRSLESAGVVRRRGRLERCDAGTWHQALQSNIGELAAGGGLTRTHRMPSLEDMHTHARTHTGTHAWPFVHPYILEIVAIGGCYPAVSLLSSSQLTGRSRTSRRHWASQANDSDSSITRMSSPANAATADRAQ
jgi:hypothetical protein|uniref:Uncharacterized protein n=1 Tax=Bionectria ochroleuca TaxID=29856 RepID=A0A8H7TP65_BIOOC